ncbi:MAG: hypothetical protein II304_03145 [Bacteroidales bacterium]|nr:hypothetical protein [Bacteroidales bacterium]
MKKIVVILGLCLFCCGKVWAEEIQSSQTVENNQAYGTVNFQKQPQEGKQKQRISNNFTFFTINVQINGKLKDSAENVN